MKKLFALFLVLPFFISCQPGSGQPGEVAEAPVSANLQFVPSM